MDIKTQERNKIQEKARDLSVSHKHLLLRWPTGTGKGKASMMCVEASTSPKPWLIVVPETLQIENYKEDLKKHGFDGLLESKIVDVICYESLDKWEGKDVNLHLNEVHRLSDLRWEICKRINYDQIISDSATIREDIERKLWVLQPYYEYLITLDEAIEMEIIPKPKIFIKTVFADRITKRNPYKFGKKAVSLSDRAYLETFDNTIDYWKKKQNEAWREGKDASWMDTKIIRTGLARKQFLAKIKTSEVGKLTQSLENEGVRFICFCGSVEQAEALGKEKSIHSGKSKKVNLASLASFNNLQRNSIYVNKMGKEGLNLEGIQKGIIAQLDSGNDEGLSFLQKTGRALRADSPEIYIFIVKDSHDEKMLERALEHIDSQYINYL